MKIPKDPVDATILAFLWAEKFTQHCLALPFRLYMKYDYWSHNRKVAKAARDAELNPYTFPNNESPEDSA